MSQVEELLGADHPDGILLMSLRAHCGLDSVVGGLAGLLVYECVCAPARVCEG